MDENQRSFDLWNLNVLLLEMALSCGLNPGSKLSLSRPRAQPTSARFLKFGNIFLQNTLQFIMKSMINIELTFEYAKLPQMEASVIQVCTS